MICNSKIMEYQKIIQLLDNTPNQPTKFRTKNWVEINDDVRGINKTDSQIKFKTSMLEPSLCDYNDAYLCDYSDAYILVKGTISIAPQKGDNPNNANKEVAFPNCVPFIDRISEINNTQIVVMLMYNLIVIGDNYSNTSGRL